MEQNISQETRQNMLKNPATLSSSELKGEGETETREEEKGKQHQTFANRWRFQYSTIDIEQCVSSPQNSKEKQSLQELCKYILKSSKKKELMICLLQPKSLLWFKQFHFIKQDSIKQVAGGKSLNAQGAASEMGSDYRILYDFRRPADYAPEDEHESSIEEEEEESVLSASEQKEDSDEEESEDKNIIVGAQRSEPKKTEKHKQMDISAKKNRESKGSRRELISFWILRIFTGDRISQIREELCQKGDLDLIWAFMQSLDLLKKAQGDPDLYEDNHRPIIRTKELLRKRQHEKPNIKEEEEEKWEKPKKIFVKEDKEEGKKVVKSEGGNKTQKVSPKKKEKKEKEVKLNPTDHDLLAESISFYKSPLHFKKTIASLPLFQKELEAFEATLTPEEIKVIEDAIETGFNPIHYIYQYKIGEKSLAKIKTGIYKKCLNTPSIEIIYKYISKHLPAQKTPVKIEDGSQEDKE